MSGLNVQAQKISILMSNAKSATRTYVKIPLGNSEKEYLPISILKGKEKGKVFTIIAGVHGYIIIPMANTASFYGRSHL